MKDKEAITLKEKHTHAGRDYPPGTTLVLAEVGMRQASAQYLVALKRAEWVKPAKVPAVPIGPIESKSGE
jgi:hypothetical protein